MEINIVVAVENTGGIGWLGDLPWEPIGMDMKFFKGLTTQGSKMAESIFNPITDHMEIHAKRRTAVVMGRKTWDSIPDKYRPLPDRINIVMSKNTSKEPTDDTYWCSCISCLMKVCVDNEVDELYVIGGEKIYDLFFQLGYIDNIYMTQVNGIYKCDRWFPSFIGDKVQESKKYTENGLEFKFSKYEVHHEQCESNTQWQNNFNIFE